MINRTYAIHVYTTMYSIYLQFGLRLAACFLGECLFVAVIEVLPEGLGRLRSLQLEPVQN